MTRKIVIYTITVVWLVFLVFLIFSSFRSPISPPLTQQMAVTKILPEGWGFFTRDAREPMTKFYTVSGSYFKEKNLSCSGRKYYYGLSRNCRYEYAEVDYLSSLKPDSTYTQGIGKLSKFNIAGIVPDTVVNRFSNHKIKGEILIVKQDRLPWAWSESYQITEMPFKYKLLYVVGN